MFSVCTMTKCTVCTCFSTEMAREIFFRGELGIGFYDWDTRLKNLLSDISTSQPLSLPSPISVDYKSYTRTTRLFVPNGSLGSPPVHPFIDLLPLTAVRKFHTHALYTSVGTNSYHISVLLSVVLPHPRDIYHRLWRPGVTTPLHFIVESFIPCLAEGTYILEL